MKKEIIQHSREPKLARVIALEAASCPECGTVGDIVAWPASHLYFSCKCGCAWKVGIEEVAPIVKLAEEVAADA